MASSHEMDNSTGSNEPREAWMQQPGESDEAWSQRLFPRTPNGDVDWDKVDRMLVPDLYNSGEFASFYDQQRKSDEPDQQPPTDGAAPDTGHHPGPPPS